MSITMFNYLIRNRIAVLTLHDKYCITTDFGHRCVVRYVFLYKTRLPSFYCYSSISQRLGRYFVGKCTSLCRFFSPMYTRKCQLFQCSSFPNRPRQILLYTLAKEEICFRDILKYKLSLSHNSSKNTIV